MIPCRRSLEFMKIESWVVEQFGSSPSVENGLARPSCRLFSPAIFSIENDKGVAAGGAGGRGGGRCVLDDVVATPLWTAGSLLRGNGRPFFLSFQLLLHPSRSRILLSREDE